MVIGHTKIGNYFRFIIYIIIGSRLSLFKIAYVMFEWTFSLLNGINFVKGKYYQYEV